MDRGRSRFCGPGRGAWAEPQQGVRRPRGPELSGPCEQSHSWEETSDSVVGTRAGGGRLASCIESSERESWTCSATLASAYSL